MRTPEWRDGDTQYSPFQRYEETRRHYTETRSHDAKAEMDKTAVESVREIWKNADPQLKNQIMDAMHE